MIDPYMELLECLVEDETCVHCGYESRDHDIDTYGCLPSPEEYEYCIDIHCGSSGILISEAALLELYEMYHIEVSTPDLAQSIIEI